MQERNGGSNGRAESRGKPVAGLNELVSIFPNTLKFCTVRFEVASGAWDTVQTWGTSQGAHASARANYIFGAPIATKKGTALSVTHDLGDVSVRLIAVDRDGAEWTSDVRSGSGVKEFVQLTVEFPLPPEQIKEFRVQTRPYEVVEIPHVALARRGGLSDPACFRHDSPLYEVAGGKDDRNEDEGDRPGFLGEVVAIVPFVRVT